jgi:hypothetical protein
MKDVTYDVTLRILLLCYKTVNILDTTPYSIPLQSLQGDL